MRVKQLLETSATQGIQLLQAAIKQSPGLDLELLRLQADLAQNNVALAKAYVAHLDAVLANLIKRTELLNQSLLYLDESRRTLGGFPRSQTVLSLLQESARRARSQDGEEQENARAKARLLLEALGKDMFAENYFDPNNRQLKVDRAKLERDFSLERSALAHRRVDILVSFGIEGLVAYHREGIRPEDIANLTRALQTAALGVIAGKLD